MRRTISEQPNLIQQPSLEMNKVLELDNLQLQEDEQIQSTNQQNQQESEPNLTEININSVSEKTLLNPAMICHIFKQIDKFQVGVIKPANTSAQDSESPSFVPIFPFMYPEVDYGDSIVDSRNAISLQLQPKYR